MTMWNEATNPYVAPDQWNYKIQYNVERTNDPSRADFIVRRGNPILGCIGIDLGVYPHVITFGSNWFNSYAENRIGKMAHEIGHRLGLGHPDQDPNSLCDLDASIMQGATNTQCYGGTNHVTGNDVAQSNKNFDSSTRAGCTVTGLTTANGTEGGGSGGGRGYTPRPICQMQGYHGGAANIFIYPNRRP